MAVIVNGGKTQLKDFTRNLPTRYELGAMANGFQYLNDYGYRWNREHYYLIDMIFMRSAFKYHYEEYLKQLPIDIERRRFKGLLLNQLQLLMLVHLENPILQGPLGMTPMVYGMSVMRATFIRKFIGSKKNGKLNHCPEMTANMVKFNFTKKQMVKGSDLVFDIIHARALELQLHWRKSKGYKEFYGM